MELTLSINEQNYIYHPKTVTFDTPTVVNEEIETLMSQSILDHYYYNIDNIDKETFNNVKTFLNLCMINHHKKINAKLNINLFVSDHNFEINILEFIFYIIYGYKYSEEKKKKLLNDDVTKLLVEFLTKNNFKINDEIKKFIQNRDAHAFDEFDAFIKKIMVEKEKEENKIRAAIFVVVVVLVVIMLLLLFL